MSAPEFVIGAVIAGRYTIRSLLFHGGSMATYRAAGKNREVALKVYDPAILSHPDVLKTLSQHRSIGAKLPQTCLPIAESGTDPSFGAPFTVTEFQSWPSLARLIERGPLSTTDVKILVDNLARAIELLHKGGVTSLSLHPYNIFVGPAPQYEVRVADFGSTLVRNALPAPEKAGRWMPWLAPEQIKAQTPAAPAADIFALALIAFFAATGRPYWRTSQAKVPDLGALRREILGERMPASVRAGEFGTTLTNSVDSVFARALAFRQAERYSTAEEFATALGAALSGRPSSEAQAARPEAPKASSANLPASGAAAAQPASSSGEAPPGAKRMAPPPPRQMRSTMLGMGSLEDEEPTIARPSPFAARPPLSTMLGIGDAAAETPPPAVAKPAAPAPVAAAPLQVKTAAVATPTAQTTQAKASPPAMPVATAKAAPPPMPTAPAKGSPPAMPVAPAKATATATAPATAKAAAPEFTPPAAKPAVAVNVPAMATPPAKTAVPVMVTAPAREPAPAPIRERAPAAAPAVVAAPVIAIAAAPPPFPATSPAALNSPTAATPLASAGFADRAAPVSPGAAAQRGAPPPLPIAPPAELEQVLARFEASAPERAPAAASPAPAPSPSSATSPKPADVAQSGPAWSMTGPLDSNGERSETGIAMVGATPIEAPKKSRRRWIVSVGGLLALTGGVAWALSSGHSSGSRSGAALEAKGATSPTSLAKAAAPPAEHVAAAEPAMANGAQPAAQEPRGAPLEPAAATPPPAAKEPEAPEPAVAAVPPRAAEPTPSESEDSAVPPAATTRNTVNTTFATQAAAGAPHAQPQAQPPKKPCGKFLKRCK